MTDTTTPDTDHRPAARWRQKSMITTSLELLVLFLLMPILVGWALILPTSLGGLIGFGSFSELSFREIRERLLPLLPLFTMVILMRIVRNRFAFYVACLAITIGYYLWLYATQFFPVVSEIRADDKLGVFSHITFAPTFIIYARVWIWAVAALLGGIYATRNRFSYWRFIAGCVIVGTLAQMLQMPFSNGVGLIIPSTALALYCVVMILLPGQRRAMEKLTGFPLSKKNPVAPARSYSAFASTAGYVILAALVIFMAYSAGINYFERRVFQIVQNGPREIWRSPALTNAYDELKELFQKDTNPSKSKVEYDQVFDEMPADFDKMLNLYSQITSTTREQIWRDVDIAAFKQYEQRLQPHIRAFESASAADYLEFPGINSMSFLPVREVSRTLAIGSQLAVRDGRTLDAVNNAATLLKFAGLLQHYHHLVGQMIGSAVRSIGVGSAYNILAQKQNDEQTMSALLTMLNEVAPNSRTAVQWEDLRRGEPGMAFSISPHPDITIPAFMRAWQHAMYGWINFDLFHIATALEYHKLKNGTYPAELQELAPGYLDRVPREPITGKNYTYKTTEAGYELNISTIPEDWTEPPHPVFQFGLKDS